MQSKVTRRPSLQPWQTRSLRLSQWLHKMKIRLTSLHSKVSYSPRPYLNKGSHIGIFIEFLLIWNSISFIRFNFAWDINYDIIRGISHWIWLNSWNQRGGFWSCWWGTKGRSRWKWRVYRNARVNGAETSQHYHKGSQWSWHQIEGKLVSLFRKF